MNFLKKLALIGFVCTLLSCYKQENSSIQTSFLKPGSQKAELLCLSEEDLSMLSEHSPEVIRKIHGKESISIADVIAMQEVGLSPDSMILIIEYTSSLFILSTADVIRLQTEGVPFKVINYMIRT